MIIAFATRRGGWRKVLAAVSFAKRASLSCVRWHSHDSSPFAACGDGNCRVTVRVGVRSDRNSLLFPARSLRTENRERSLHDEARDCDRDCGAGSEGSGETTRRSRMSDGIKASNGICRAIRASPKREERSSFVDERTSFLPFHAACCGEKQRAVQ